MNFLAHLMLSGDREEVIVGNYVGDFIKGKLTPERVASWSPDYLLGVRLHRFIDSYTDTHPAVRQVRQRVALTHGKVAGVAVDIFFDHFLAINFETYRQETLPNFCARMYSILEKQRPYIPLAMIPMAESMMRHNWLLGYREIAGIRRSFDGLAHRFTFMAAIRGAEQDLEQNYLYYNSLFQPFFRELEEVSQTFIQNNH
ncbi:ACP phosphodiesterase [Telluribacter sp.]|uniref:acyl carrier protein phosphodiesterase n=1 Tax=Telluribacter sp. TaxID=1978767 RepID=UPI002E0F3A32|nr:ACP phosphodiesterase [Telluribacter sp.]